MKRNEIIAKANNMFGKTTIKLKKYSPEILIVAGVVGTVASTVLACRATMKVNDILDESKENIEKIHEVSENPEMADKYSSEDAKKDLAIVYAQTGVKLAKLYAPAVALGVLSITGIVASNQILKKRNVALAAAYATVDKTFKEYRSKVVERFGEQVDKELRYDIKAKKIEEKVVDPETGKEKKTKSTIEVVENGTNGYMRFFDETCKGYENNMDYNLMFLKAQQQLANDMLRSRGHLFLNEVYDMLGIDHTKEGQILGWTYRENNPDGDNFVDFGVMVTNRMVDDNTHEAAIVINPNVDGYVLDLI